MPHLKNKSYCLTPSFPICLGLISQALSLSSKQNCYNYFAYGSNMALSTMTNLRKLHPLASTAAVLPHHRLRFDIPGIPLVEPSFASVQPAERIGKNDIDVVHGVLYKLTEEDFVKVCQTEGVPFSYRLHRCRPIPYSGDGKIAGCTALEAHRDSNEKPSISALTLTAAPSAASAKDIAPSQAYLNVLLRGAKEFSLDSSYVKKLERIKAGRTIFGIGLAENMLTAAERRYL